MNSRLTRSRTDRNIGGVCAGLANYVGIDPTMMRIGVVILALLSGGTAIPMYLILWLVMPQEGSALDTRATFQNNLNDIKQQATSLLNRVGVGGQRPADWRFDPHTGQPIQQPTAQPQVPPPAAPSHAESYTGQTIHIKDESAPKPRFDPYTGQPIEH